MVNNYRRGRAKEHHAIALLKRQGYVSVRAAGSKGAYDIVAWKDGGPCRCIQVKREERAGNSTYPAERRRLALAPCPAGGQRELWVWADDLRTWRAQLIVKGEEEYEAVIQLPIKRRPVGRPAKTMEGKGRGKRQAGLP